MLFRKMLFEEVILKWMLGVSEESLNLLSFKLIRNVFLVNEVSRLFFLELDFVIVYLFINVY